MDKIRQKKGFTLIELIITTAVLVVLISLVFAAQSRVLANTYLDSNTDQIKQTLWLAQTKSQSGLNNSSWGVNFDNTLSEFTIFKGESYSTRDSSFDITTPLPSSLNFSSISLNQGGNSVIFTQYSGETDNYGSITLSNSENIYNIIQINSKGLISITQSP
ncbi:prepilin-type N-terminal cleavage/methylation domain-containing protein [Candidatus Peregrinibacteria bacterium]|nr:prepilin-type N-terminal cleavage/methylation domain-containing protein [Candidatus Peregrinibacteria bacterium]